ncbi:NAD-dependent epimerase/dehydratase family protein [Angustibacter sp. McL0619]|uniref:NAD-dependent epimerase/dehydratase family protein n=1 Tax=Angustibacter sp. McL0619 TaxID=3415676 RepID=UPI003CEF31FC
MRIAVTGASGLVGGQVVAAAAASGHQVRAVVRRRVDVPGAGPGAVIGEDFETVRASLADPDSLRAAFAGCDAVVHCAAVYAFGAERAAEVERVNTTGTVAVVQAAADAGAGRVVVTSSSVTRGSAATAVARTELDVLGDEPAPAYYASKVEQERLALQAGEHGGVAVLLALPTVVLGGPAARLVPSNAIVLRYLLDLTRSTYPGGCNVVDARDVGHGHVLLLERGEAGQRYLLGGQNLSWRALHATVAELAGLPGPFLEVPRPLAQAMVKVADGWGRLTSSAPLVTADEADTVGRWYWYDHARASALGYSPRSGRDALASSLAWLLVGDKVPRWVREGLSPSAEVRAARPLVPRSL